jgi:hypothetical protein
VVNTTSGGNHGHNFGHGWFGLYRQPLHPAVPTWQLPDWLVRIAALRDPAVRQILPELGKVKNASNEKAKRWLGWAPRSNEEAIVSAAEGMLRLAIISAQNPQGAR